jgi:hypothetical protein
MFDQFVCVSAIVSVSLSIKLYLELASLSESVCSTGGGLWFVVCDLWFVICLRLLDFLSSGLCFRGNGKAVRPLVVMSEMSGSRRLCCKSVGKVFELVCLS